jgi:monoamine oxidase
MYTAGGRLLSQAERVTLHTHFEQLLAEVEEARETLDEDMALGTALERAMIQQRLSWQQQRDLWHCIHTTIEQDYATDAANLSLRYWDECHDFHGVHGIFPHGYDQIIDRLAVGLNVKLGHVVQQIIYDDKGVKLLTNQGAFKADRIIVTLPLGVLQDSTVVFAPPLPSRKVAAIQNLHMGVLNKLYLRFPACFWPPGSEWLEYMGQERRSWTQFFNLFKYFGKPMLVGFSAGTYGRALERLSDQTIVAEAMHVLRTIYGVSIPNPEAWHMTRWGSDPFAGGSYVYIPPGASGEDCDTLAEPVGERLFFAGEATQRLHYATVHGAFWSGVQAARRLIEPASASWVASQRSSVYHVSQACVDAQDIAPENRIRGPAAQQGRRRHLACPRRPHTKMSL